MKVLISVSQQMPIGNFQRSFRDLPAECCYRYLGEYEREFDALILAGGGDIAPEPGEDGDFYYCVDRARDEAERRLLMDFMKAGKPVLGICRGHQLIAWALGGKLIPHLGTVEKHQDFEGDVKHWVSARRSGFLFPLYGEHFSVNSAHHQGVAVQGEGMIESASASDGVCEASEHLELPIRSVQWHPERMEEGKKLFADFLEKIRENTCGS